MNDLPPLPQAPPVNDPFVDSLLAIEEGSRFETKRIGGEKLTRALESVSAFANTDGGTLILGFEDAGKSIGRKRVIGIQEKPPNVDELKRLILSRIAPPLQPQPEFIEIGCTLHDDTMGSIVVVIIAKSAHVHSIIEGGTWIRIGRGNRQMTAEEITRLSMERSAISAEAQLVDVPTDLLNTDYWRLYAANRRLTRPIAEALRHLGLAKEGATGHLQPVQAAVLLFAENPGGLLASKASIRVFHYKGERIEPMPTPNLLKPPVSFSGPIVTQIQQAFDYIARELATSVQMGPLGFEIVQKYPARVIREAITNAVIHRDYSIAADTQIRIFSDRIEIDSPGNLPGKVTVQNIQEIGSVTRNPLLVSNLREFPEPPNLDAGEGVRMMFSTMESANLYPPTYRTRATTNRDRVLVVLFNQERPSLWHQVSLLIKTKGSISNSDVRQIMKTDDTLTASKLLRWLVERGLLIVANPNAAKQHRRYTFPEQDPTEPLFSNGTGKQLLEKP